jgi:hypothetical protein
MLLTRLALALPLEVLTGPLFRLPRSRGLRPQLLLSPLSTNCLRRCKLRDRSNLTLPARPALLTTAPAATAWNSRMARSMTSRSTLLLLLVHSLPLLCVGVHGSPEDSLSNVQGSLATIEQRCLKRVPLLCAQTSCGASSRATAR